MRYIVIANHGAYTAGDVFDFGDDEAAANLMRATGISLLRIPDAPQPVVTQVVSVPLPKPELRRVAVLPEPNRNWHRSQPRLASRSIAPNEANMANELQVLTTSGQTLYAVLLNSVGKIWNGTTFVTIAGANWTAYDIALTEAVAGLYLADMPAVDAGIYQFAAYARAGVAPAISDSQVYTGAISWDGTTVTAPAGTSRYASVAELKTWIGITDAVDDTLLATVLDEASRDIDNYCGRIFYQTAAGTVRYYMARRSDELLIADCVSLTEVATDADGDRTYEDTWTATDYDLLPENAAADSEPYTTIAVAPGGDYGFPSGVRKGVKLTGVWGWPAVPGAVKQACLLRAAWIFNRRGTPLGLAGSADIGMVRVGRWDPDFEKMLETYRHVVVT